MCDLIDLFENGIAANQGKDGTALKTFLEGDRLPKILGNIERSIRGPFYFGASPTKCGFPALVSWTGLMLLSSTA